MLAIRTIVVPTDYSETARRAFDHASFIAQRHGAELYVLHVWEAKKSDVETTETSSWPNGSAGRDVTASYADGSDAQMVEPTGEGSGGAFNAEIAGAAWQTLSPAGAIRPKFVRRTARTAADGILDFAREIDADLIAMGTHGRSGARRLLMGSVAESVVAMSEFPVLTVRAGGLSMPGQGVSKILVPVDFSAVSKRQVHHAQELADAYGAALDILHVIDLPSFPAFYRIDQFHSEVPALATRVRQALIELTETGGPEVSTRVHVLVGHPARDILDFAEAQESDLIVFATHTSTGARHMLLGSVAEQVLRRAPLLVATISEGGKSLLPSETENSERADRKGRPWRRPLHTSLHCF